MKIIGTIIGIFEEVSGVTTKNNWRKKDFLIKTNDRYPKEILFTLWGERIDEFKVELNDSLDVYIDIESRKYNEKWFTSIKAWKIERNELDPSLGKPLKIEDDFLNFENQLPF
jgi:hypothetical protein